MKSLLILITVLFSLHASAEIFVCKDSKNKITYQDKQCSDLTVRKLYTLPAPSEEEQYQAQERINKMTEQSEQRAALATLERQRQEQNKLELEKLALEKRRLDLLEQQVATEQASRYIVLDPRFRPGFHRRHFHHDNHNTGMRHTKSDGDLKLNTK